MSHLALQPFHPVNHPIESLESLFTGPFVLCGLSRLFLKSLVVPLDRLLTRFEVPPELLVRDLNE